MKWTVLEISWHNRDPVLCLDFQYANKNISRLATGGTDSHVLVWLVKEITNGQVEVECVSDLARHNRAVNAVRFSPDGKILASGDDEAFIWLWKLSDKAIPDIFANESESENKEFWSPIKSLRTHVEDICDISWSADSRFLISGSVDNTAILWDVERGRNLGILSEHKGFVQGVAWDPCHEFVATLSSDRSCRIYNIQTQKCIHRIHKLNLQEETQQKCVRMYSDDTLKSFCRRLTFTPKGELLITPAGVLEMDNDSKINVVYIFARKSLNKPVVYLPIGDKSAVAVRCCPVLFQLRNLDKNKLNEKFTTKSGENLFNNFTLFELPYRIVFAVATLNSILIYDTQQPLPLAQISKLHYTRLTDITWSQDGSVLAASSTDGYCSFITFGKGELGVPYGENENSSERGIESINNGAKETKNEETLEPMQVDDITEENMDIKEQKNGNSANAFCGYSINPNKASSSKIENDTNSDATLPASNVKPPRRIQFITLSSPKQLKSNKKPI